VGDATIEYKARLASLVVERWDGRWEPQPELHPDPAAVHAFFDAAWFTSPSGVQEKVFDLFERDIKFSEIWASRFFLKRIAHRIARLRGFHHERVLRVVFKSVSVQKLLETSGAVEILADTDEGAVTAVAKLAGLTVEEAWRVLERYRDAWAEYSTRLLQLEHLRFQERNLDALS